MDEAWERAVEAAKGDEDPGTTRSLTLDGALKCAQGRLPPASLFESFAQLRHLSIANVGLASLTDFPSLPHLEQLILSDNRIAGGLEHLVKAGLKALRDLDLSNNKIQSLDDLAPLSQLRLVSLDLYECQVTRLPDYRARVFEMMKTLQYLDKADANNNERPESDEEEEEESDDEDVDDANGDGIEVEGVDGDSKGGAVTLQDEDDEEGEEDEERDENDEVDEDDEEEGASYQEAGVAASRDVPGRYNNDNGSDEEEVEDDDDAEENVEVQDIEESEEEDAGEDDEDAGAEDDDDEEGTEHASGALVSTEGELDVQENDDNEEDENGELGEDEEEDAEDFGVDNEEDDDDVDEEEEEDEEPEEDDEEQEEEEYGTEYLVQPLGHAEDDEGASDFEPGDDDEEEDDDFDVEDDDEEEEATLKAEAAAKRKRSRDDDMDKSDVRPPKH